MIRFDIHITYKSVAYIFAIILGYVDINAGVYRNPIRVFCSKTTCSEYSLPG